MAGLGIHTQVESRNRWGQFRAALDRGGIEAVSETTRELEALARANAPTGPGRHDYGRRPKLRPSIQGHASGKVGHVGSTAPQAPALETGGAPHPIPNAFGRGITVEHPGNPAFHFLKRAADAIMPRFQANIKKFMP